jgi:vanillate O-demethylase ferredoxin subunit
MTVSQPRNNFPLIWSNGFEPVLLFAAGIGITPILAMAYELTAKGAPFSLHYCTRSKAQTAFLDEILQSRFADATRIYFDDAVEQRFNAADSLLPVKEHGRIYICGPDGFIRHVVQTARSLGVDDHRVHREAFLPMGEQSSANQAFVVKLAKSGQEFSVLPGKSIVETLEEANIFIPTTCRQGICGMCITNVLLGEPDHRDAFLTEQEKKQNDCITPCCSRSISPALVLDI